MLYSKRFIRLSLALALLCPMSASHSQTKSSQSSSPSPGATKANSNGMPTAPSRVENPAHDGTGDTPGNAAKPSDGDEFGHDIAISKADRKLHRAVTRALAKSKGIDVRNVEIRAKNGNVVLEGSVPEDEQKLRAGEIASSTPGVTSVKNALTVQSAGH